METKARTVRHGITARQALLDGADKLVRAVSVTYGPNGRTAILDRFAGLLSTKDGVTVAREVELELHGENLGSRVLREACIKVNDEVGDGTTTAAIVAGSLLREGHKLIAAGMEPRALLRGIRAASEAALDTVQQLAIPVTGQHHLEEVALIACNNDEEVAKNMATACMAVGKDGTVLIEDSSGVETTLDFKEGMELATGAASPHFLDNAVERVIEGPLVAVINQPLQSLEDVRELMEVASQWPQNHLLVLAPVIEGAALTTMAVNHTEGVVKCCAVKAPGMPHIQPDYLEDIAVMSAADFVDPAAGYNIGQWDAEWFGSFRKATIRSDLVTFEAYPAVDDDVQKRIAFLKGQLAASTSGYEEDRLQERMAKLSGGLAVLKVGGVTEAALKERRARVEDALGAVRASLKDGLVPGGAVAYFRASEALLAHPDRSKLPVEEKSGWDAMARGLAEPVRVLSSNAGKDAPLIAFEIAGRDDLWEGWDARSDEVRNLGTAPIVADPTAVALSVITAATSVVSTLLTVECSVTMGA